MTDRPNALVADRLREAADLLEQQNANPFRVRAYRGAADTIAGLDEDIEQLVERRGVEGLVALPSVGKGIAAAVVEILQTGRWSQVDRLRGVLDAAQLFQAVPGIGPELAQRIHEHLQVDTLEALEAAAHDGRLESVPGVGARRAAGIRAALASMLSRRRVYQAAAAGGPPVEKLLAVDAEYRDKAQSGQLPTIAPRRFNPEQTAWLPILHSVRDHWHFTALYSNTARAHELDRTRDWVVIYFYDDHHREGQHTVVTETRGALIGRRVVRGREAECRAYYEAHRSQDP
ncbi:MAG: helix-hairpin-helix domain-containing protein [Gammaproteobacteria bacterium]|jgi:putative hydrolase